MIKTKQDNDMSNHTSAIYTEKETELSWPIGPSAVCDENQLGIQCD